MPEKIKNILALLKFGKAINVIVLLVIVAAIPLTVFIAQKQQEIRQRASEDKQVLPPYNSPFELGLGYHHVNTAFDQQGIAWNKIVEVASIVYIQRSWQGTGQGDFITSVASDVSSARSKGLKIYLSFEPLTVRRESLSLPDDLKNEQGGFSNQKIRESYINMVKNIASTYNPEYFVINVEANTYKQFNPTDYESYKTLYAQAYNVIKSVSPQTKVAASIVYSDYNGQNCYDSSDKAKFQGFVNDFTSGVNKMDILAVSAYPSCYMNPNNIPDQNNFLYDVSDPAISNLPVFITETGWISQGIQLSQNPPIYIGGNDQQADYIQKLSSLINSARTNGRNIIAVNYISLVDPDDANCGIIPVDISWYCSLSLLDKYGNEKTTTATGTGTLISSFTRMKEWKARLSVFNTFTPTPQPSFVCSACAADINKSGRVDNVDYQRFMACSGKKSTDKDVYGRSCAPADINGSGIVDSTDYSCLAQKFNQTCSTGPTATPFVFPTAGATTPFPTKVLLK